MSDVVTKDVTLDSRGGTGVATGTQHPATVGERGMHGYDHKIEVVKALQSYMNEAKDARQNGLNPRDDKWRQNLDLYWGRYDFKEKAAWQAKEVMPEVPSYVDRFAAALKEALVALPEGFYTITDPMDKENNMAEAIKRVTDVWLSGVGRNSVGQLMPFSSVFEEQIKLGAMMSMSSITTWKDDVEGGRVAIETVDPQMVWLDHTYRNLYRIRRLEVDLHELAGMKAQVDAKGNTIFNAEEMDKLSASIFQKRVADEERTGTGQQITSARKPVVLDEYIATVVGPDGRVIADRSYMVLANENYLVRGPEKNPFWHGKDWLTYTPLVVTPLSPYGRSYMEDFGSVAQTFNTLTNMILDAVHMTSMKMFAMVPGMLLNPNQALEGASPNKLFLLEDGYRAEDFAKALDLGTLPAEAVRVWDSMKATLSEAADMNEIGLGQFAPKGRTSATEINQAQQSSSALIRSVAQTIETRYLDTQIDLVWKTGLQHAKANNEQLRAAAGDEMWEAMMATRRELIRRPFTFQARGISTMIGRGAQLKALLGIIQVISANQALAQGLLQKVDPNKLIERLFLLSGVDLTKLQLSERERLMAQAAQPLQAAQQASAGAPPMSDNGAREVSDVANALGAV